MARAVRVIPTSFRNHQTTGSDPPEGIIIRGSATSASADPAVAPRSGKHFFCPLSLFQHQPRGISTLVSSRLTSFRRLNAASSELAVCPPAAPPAVVVTGLPEVGGFFTCSVAAATVAARSVGSFQNTLAREIESAFTKRQSAIPMIHSQALEVRLYQPETRSIESLNQPSRRVL